MKFLQYDRALLIYMRNKERCEGIKKGYKGIKRGYNCYGKKIESLMQAATSLAERHLEKLERIRINLNNRVYLIL